MIGVNGNFWKSRELKTYGIERKERRICFGNPGYIDEWVYVDSFDAEEERDAELKRLQQFSFYPIERPDGWHTQGNLQIEYRAVTNRPTMMMFK